MTSASEEIRARALKYNRIERASDSIGRVIGVKRLRPSQQLQVEEFSSALTGVDRVVNPDDGTEVEIPRRTVLFYAAAVCEIDGEVIPFAKNRAQLDAILDRLDGEGLTAAIEALGKLNDRQPDENSEDKAKN